MEMALLGDRARGGAHVAAHAERALAGTREDDDADGVVVGRRLEGLAELPDRLDPERVQLVRAVDRDGGAPTADLVDDVLELQGVLLSSRSRGILLRGARMRHRTAARRHRQGCAGRLGEAAVPLCETNDRIVPLLLASGRCALLLLTLSHELQDMVLTYET
jgi:hypothetical protein